MQSYVLSDDPSPNYPRPILLVPNALTRICIFLSTSSYGLKNRISSSCSRWLKDARILMWRNTVPEIRSEKPVGAS